MLVAHYLTWQDAQNSSCACINDALVVCAQAIDKCLTQHFASVPNIESCCQDKTGLAIMAVLAASASAGKLYLCVALECLCMHRNVLYSHNCILCQIPVLPNVSTYTNHHSAPLHVQLAVSACACVQHIHPYSLHVITQKICLTKYHIDQQGILPEGQRYLARGSTLFRQRVNAIPSHAAYPCLVMRLVIRGSKHTVLS